MDKIEEYVEGWKNKLTAKKEKTKEKFAGDSSVARRCAEILYSDFKVKSVYLVGSLTRPGKYHLRSDIDLLVEGLPAEKYIKALSVCSRQLPPDQTIDLIRLEDLTEEERMHLLGQGVSIAA